MFAKGPSATMLPRAAALSVIAICRWRESIMAAEVKVIITGIQKGKTLVVPYSHHQGLQFVVVGGVRTRQASHLRGAILRGACRARRLLCCRPLRPPEQRHYSQDRATAMPDFLTHSSARLAGYPPTARTAFAADRVPVSWQLLPERLPHSRGADTRKDRLEARSAAWKSSMVGGTIFSPRLSGWLELRRPRLAPAIS